MNDPDIFTMVEYPINVSPTADENFKPWEYASYNFAPVCFWTTHLVCCKETRPQEISTLELDEPHETWASEIHAFDYHIISRVRWFTHPMLFYEERKLVVCHCCLMDNVKDVTKFYGYQKAIRTVFRKINATKDYKGITYLRTLSPSHFENGIRNKGGNCVRTRLFLSNETVLGGDEMEMYMIQVEEFRRAEEGAEVQVTGHDTGDGVEGGRATEQVRALAGRERDAVQ
ncbi:hypothetical protein MLD38_001538 [Melastoma candidum]|uniref:Uncharacterized protein n=1 Tax=Melastoma candidum TaxID=119954 RepID=A0ACB9SEJ6_9MYRT|nr:hypothetical protein MLD38_001538 [Melastoma candidum]